MSAQARVGALAFVGGLGVAAAALLPTYAADSLQKIPLNVEADTLSLAPDSSVIDVQATMTGKATTETHVPLGFRVYVTVQDPADGEVVTLQAARSMIRTDDPESEPLDATVDRVSLDRRSGLPVPDPPASFQTEADRPGATAVRDGYQYKFPFDTQRESYPYYDTTLGSSAPIDFVDAERAERGLRLYHFQQRIGPTNLRLLRDDEALTLPASAWGLAGDDQVTFDLWYAVTRDIWVEPVSGAIVAQEEQVHRYLARTIDDHHALTTLAAHTTFDDATIADNAARAATARTQILWGTRYIPIGSAVVAVLAFSAAAATSWRAIRTRQRGAIVSSTSSEVISG